MDASARGAERSVDLLIGVVGATVVAGRSALRAVDPLITFVLRPPLTPKSMQPQTWLDALTRAGHEYRMRAAPELDAMMGAVANNVAARIDVDAIIARIDLGGIARRLIDEIDLPEIIRASSGTMASETVLGMRMQGIEADDRVRSVVDKMLLRRNSRSVRLPTVVSDDDIGP